MMANTNFLSENVDAFEFFIIVPVLRILRNGKPNMPENIMCLKLFNIT